MYFDLAHFEVSTRDRFGSRMPPLPNPSSRARVPSVATGVCPHTKRSKIGDLVPVHVGTWYAFTAMSRGQPFRRRTWTTSSRASYVVSEAPGVVVPHALYAATRS